LQPPNADKQPLQKNGADAGLAVQAVYGEPVSGGVSLETGN
jgi:hypothetical protein